MPDLVIVSVCAAVTAIVEVLIQVGLNTGLTHHSHTSTEKIKLAVRGVQRISE